MTRFAYEDDITMPTLHSSSELPRQRLRPLGNRCRGTSADCVGHRRYNGLGEALQNAVDNTGDVPVYLNFHGRGVFGIFERAQSARSRIAEHIEILKIVCRPSEVGIWFTACLMRHLISVFTNFRYKQLKIKANI